MMKRSGEVYFLIVSLRWIEVSCQLSEIERNCPVKFVVDGYIAEIVMDGRCFERR